MWEKIKLFFSPHKSLGEKKEAEGNRAWQETAEAHLAAQRGTGGSRW